MSIDSPIQNFYLSFRAVCPGSKHGRLDPARLHYHTELHFYFVLEGSEELAFPVPTESTTLRAGDAAFVNALQLHARRPSPESVRRKTFCLGFAPSSASWFPARCEPFRRPLANDPGMRHAVFRKGDGGAKGAILRELALLAVPDGIPPREEQASLHRILGALLRMADPRLRFDDAARRSRMDRFVGLHDDILRRAADKSLTPLKFAAAHGLPESRADALCREFAGMPVAAFLREARVRAAAWEIGHGRLTIKEAAAHYGFSSASNFARELRRRYGTSPSLFRDGAIPPEAK